MRRGGQEDVLGVEPVLFRVFGGHGLERSRADGEREVRDGDAARADAIEDVFREMQAGGRRGDRHRLSREDGLIGLPVLGPVGGPRLPPDVGRERNVADPLEKSIVHLPVESHFAPAVRADRRDNGRESVLEADPPPLLRAPARLRQGFPFPAAVRGRAQQEDLDQSALFVPPIETREPDADVVSHEQVAAAQELRELGEPPVLDGAGSAVEHEQPARPAGPRLLRDQVRREKVIEEGYLHGPRVICESWPQVP